MHALTRPLIAALLAAQACAAQAQGRATRPGTFCWPMHYAGVVAGTSQDPHVVRLLGPGAHRPAESDGVRYFVDPRATMTMTVSTFTDGVVGEIALEQGVSARLTPAERARAVSPFLRPDEGFGNGHALRLGATQGEVRRNLGRPAAAQPGAWVFNSACAGELPQYLTLYFEQGRVRRVVFSAPPG